MSLLNKQSSPMNNPLVVALDLDDIGQVLNLADDLAEVVGGFKIGPRLVIKYGEKIIQEVAARGPVFLDHKYFDIPSTMLSAVQSSFDCGASLVTVHALSGQEALTLLAQLEKKLNLIRPFKILVVTVLTSWEQNSLPPNFQNLPISQHVQMMVSLVRSSGLTGVVCSAHELTVLQNQGLYICTPGIRFDLENHQDQKRVMTPSDAIKLGANILVVGRPIVQSKNPKEAASKYV